MHQYLRMTLARLELLARHIGAAACAAILLTAGTLCAIPARADPAAPPARAWTVMIYMNGKNTLEGDALNNFHAIASIGSSDQVAIVTQMGRPAKHHTQMDGGWSGVYRFYVRKNQDPLPRQAVAKLPAGVASDMGKRATLSAFISWTKATYPAQHYMVIVWNHGQGYRELEPALSARRARAAMARRRVPGLAPGIQIGGFRAVSSDDDTGSIMYNAEVEQAIAANFTRTKLDVLGFDACLMAMIETGYAVAPSTRLMVASEELEPGDGWHYATWLDKLVATPSMTGEALGTAVVESYRAQYGDDFQTTLSVLDLAAVRDAAGALTKLSDNIRAAGPTELAALRDARKDLASYADSEQPPQKLSVDLITLLDRYQIHTQDARLRAEAASVIAALRPLVRSNYASSRSVGTPGVDFYGSQGLAIYFPATKADFLGDYFHGGYLKANTDRPIAFVQQEHWAELLYAVLDLP